MNLERFIAGLRRYQDTPKGYLLAFGVLVLAVVIRELVDPLVKIPFVTLFPAMVICSLVGGRLAGILTAVIGGILAWYLWLPPRHTFSLEWPAGHLTVGLYIATSWILLLLTRGLNETLRALESERDLSSELFKELQHRTANNLQSVSSLLAQNRKAIMHDASVALEVIDTARRRFELMSSINRKLYDPKLADLNATTVLQELCDELTVIGADQSFTCHVEASPVQLTRDRAMLISLLVAELLINAGKHAFMHNDKSGRINISLKAIDSRYLLSFVDNGKGFDPASVKPGLGSQIMQGLVAQLNGTMRTISGSSGTTVEVEWPQR